MLELIRDRYPDNDIFIMNGMNNAIIGYNEKSNCVIYSVKKIILELQKEMSRQDAIEYYEFNIESTYVGENTPILCYDMF